MRRIQVIGGGIAGVETAITLARGLPDDHVELLAHSETLRITPDLLYVPTGVDVQRIEVPMRELLQAERVTLRLCEVEQVDLDARVARTDMGDVPFDVLVAAPGAAPVATGALQLGSVEDALELGERLDDLFAQASSSEARGAIVIRAEADDAWAPPAYELAMLLAARRRMLGVEHLVSILLATEEMQPFQWFDPRVADIVVDALQGWGIEVATGVSPSMLSESSGDVVVDVPRLEPRHVPGVPGRGDDGWYDVDSDGRVHRDVFVVGDAARHGFKSAFAAGWEARRVLVALGGRLSALGVAANGIPVDSAEHHVDLGTRTMRIRIPVAARLQDPWLGHDVAVHIDDAPPDHLAGLLVGEVMERFGGNTAARAHRALVTRPGSRTPREVPVPHASSHVR